MTGRVRRGLVWVVGLALALPLAAQWPEFRGPTGNGHAPEGSDPPVTWSETEHVAWKVEVPGEGFSSPVIDDGRVWLTTALEASQSLRLLAFDVRDGSPLHDVEVLKPGAWQPGHADNSYASPTPVAEGGRVYAHFGTYGTVALDATDGRVLWRNDQLPLEHETGPGSSPILHGDLLIFHLDGTDTRGIVALHKDTGAVAWRTPRSVSLADRNPPHRKAFSTPLVVRYRGQDQLISPAAQQVSAYDPATGDELWRVRYEGYSNVPRPVAGFGMVFVNTGYMKPRMLAIHLGGEGDVTDSRVVWSYHWQVPANPSPLLINDRLYLVSDHGRATWLDARKGEGLWRQRLGGNFTASPIVAAGRIYNFRRDGETIVLAASDTFEILARNPLDGVFRASPAVINDALVLRTTTHLYRIETPPEPSEP